MITSLFKKITVALALVGAMGAASAAPVLVNFKTFNDTLSYTHLDISGDFHDALYFKADTVRGAAGSIVSFDFLGDLTGFYQFGVGDTYDTVSWFKDSRINLATVDIISAYTQQFPTLQSGQTYWFEIAGNMSMGYYTAKVMPTMVPEPGSMALVLAGVAAMGAITRRRKYFAKKIGA